jgi:tetratricopeptide (TPR) repeat protein
VSTLSLLLLLAAQDPKTHLTRGADLLQLGRPAAAAIELKRALAMEPRSAAAHQLLGQAYLAQGAVEFLAEAKAEFQQALDLDPGLVWARFYLAKIYLDLGRLDRARQELERGLDIRPDTPHLLSLLGEAHRRIGDPQRSVELNSRALIADPAFTPANYYRALASLDLASDDEAARDLERAVASPHVIPEMYVALGAIHLRRENLEPAAANFRKAIALDPQRPEGHLRLAEVLRRRKAYEQALAELKLALPEPGRFLSTEYYQKLRAGAWFETGRVYQEQGKRDRAADAYRRALESDPSHEGARRELAIAVR